MDDLFGLDLGQNTIASQPSQRSPPTPWPAQTSAASSAWMSQSSASQPATSEWPQLTPAAQAQPTAWPTQTSAASQDIFGWPPQAPAEQTQSTAWQAQPPAAKSQASAWPEHSTVAQLDPLAQPTAWSPQAPAAQPSSSAWPKESLTAQPDPFGWSQDPSATQSTPWPQESPSVQQDAFGLSPQSSATQAQNTPWPPQSSVPQSPVAQLPPPPTQTQSSPAQKPTQHQQIVTQTSTAVQKVLPTQQNPPPTAQPTNVAIASNIPQGSTGVAKTNSFTTSTPISPKAQGTSSNSMIWNPSSVQDEPKDPVLKEIKEKFGGCWRLARSDPYDEYLKAAGVGIISRKLAIATTPDQIISIRGNYIHIDTRAKLNNQDNIFKLEESVENLVEKSRQSVFCSYKDGKLTLLMTPLEPGLNRTQEVQRFINEYGELVLIYTCGTATCRRYFTRIADLVTPLNIVG